MLKKNIRRKLAFWKSTSIFFVVILLMLNVLFEIKVSPRFGKAGEIQQNSVRPAATQENISEEKIFPKGGEELPVAWNDLGRKMIENGVIDKNKFEQIYGERGGLDEYEKKLLDGVAGGNLKITRENAGFLLNMFWALGLSNKNPILDEGPMQDKQYGGAGVFASTGGWTVSKGNPMDHYSKYDFIALTKDQQTLVETVSRNIYRPCCNNSTYFPDCNHGMAMLGFLELMASQGVSEETMYQAAMKLNAYWFPSNYLTLAKYFEAQGTLWEKIDPKTILGKNFSSSSGYGQILAKVQPVQTKGGGACGV